LKVGLADFPANFSENVCHGVKLLSDNLIVRLGLISFY